MTTLSLKPITKQLDIEEEGFLVNIRKQIHNSYTVMTFNSKMIEEYYQEVISYQTKCNLRNNIKVMLFTILTFSILENMNNIPNLMMLFGELLTIQILIILYIATIYVNKGSNITTFGFCVTIIFYMSFMLTHYNQFGFVETSYSPVIQINMLIFTNMPFKFLNIFSVALLGYTIVIATPMFLFQQKKIYEEYYNKIHLENPKVALDQMPLTDISFNTNNYFKALIVTGISVLFLCGYFYFINNLRRRSAFIRLGQNIQAKGDIKAATKKQIRWIDAIMPRIVKNEYWEHNLEIKAEKWIYIKSFENVSILFADIVGFTNMSSNKTALKVVTLLNDLFNRFDVMCNLTNCEKLGTLGDCYYCVAGCPMPTTDHATSCIEMGLGMCHIIQMFNKDYEENVNMRVGVHTGKVNAAIIGKQRFRFDVYGNDVIIANTMESSGQPGRVHISQAVHSLVKTSYKVEKGEEVEIKREEDHGIAGMLLKSVFIKTFFVDPKSARIKPKDYQNRFKQNHFEIINTDKYSDSNETGDSEDLFGTISFQKKVFSDKVQSDVNFINALKFDSDRQIELFSQLPISLFTMRFLDPEIEWHYTKQKQEDLELLTLDSLKAAPLLDSVMCSIYSTLLYLTVIILMPVRLTVIVVIILTSVISYSIVIIMSWHCHVSKYQIESMHGQLMYFVLSNHITKSVLCFYFTASPFIIVTTCYYDCHKFINEYSFTNPFFTLVFFSLLVIPLYFSAHYIFKACISTMLITIAIIILFQKPCSAYNYFLTFDYNSCLGRINVTNVTFQERARNVFILQIIFIYIAAHLIIREIERNMRLSFYVARDAAIGREEAGRAKKDAEEMLYNIIPKYVFVSIDSRAENNLDVADFSYANSLPQAGVVFACISNFFSKYYREDYKGGENALRLLHQIICIFDNMLKATKYKDVEKVKTINDCYMVVSGLNPLETEKNASKFDHLTALMLYSLQLIEELNIFNENYIIGTDKFEIKIGYNFGPITAGIIGKTKPLYDIWGDTVNVASRMYSTGVANSIQVPAYVEKQLRGDFEFMYRGKIFVKGKGKMHTYFCIRYRETITQQEIKLGTLKSRSTISHQNSVLSYKPSLTNRRNMSVVHEKSWKFSPNL